MNDYAYGAYHDIVVEFVGKLIETMPDRKDEIEKAVYVQAHAEWAQSFFTSRTRAEQAKEYAGHNRTLSESELASVAKSTSGIAEVIKSKLFPSATDMSPLMAKQFDDFAKACDQRLKDYNPYWHPFYQKQQSETVQALAARSATIFDPTHVAGFRAQVMKNVWQNKIRPLVADKITDLMEKGIETSDKNVLMSMCLLNHMFFIDQMVEHAKAVIAVSNVDNGNICRHRT